MNLKIHLGFKATPIKPADSSTLMQISKILLNLVNYWIRNKHQSQLFRDWLRQVYTIRDLLKDTEPIATSQSNILGQKHNLVLFNSLKCHGTSEQKQSIISSAVWPSYWWEPASSDWPNE
jgi:hypothetical protein